MSGSDPGASQTERWVWPAVGGATAVCSGVIAAPGRFPDLFVLPVICVLTAFSRYWDGWLE